jgi:hypothetical protein
MDLSAAGANIFNALVEMQRLRAASERRFQRELNEKKPESEGQRVTEMPPDGSKLIRKEVVSREVSEKEAKSATTWTGDDKPEAEQ